MELKLLQLFFPVSSLSSCRRRYVGISIPMLNAHTKMYLEIRILDSWMAFNLNFLP